MPRSQTISVSAPVGGVNARDSLAAMPPTDAIIMDNWFPTPSGVVVRNGNIGWVAVPGVTNTVMAWNGFASRKVFATGNSSAGGGAFQFGDFQPDYQENNVAGAGLAIYDVTLQGAAGAPIVTGLSGDMWQFTMFNGGAGNLLIAVDGVDPPMRYDGAVQGSLSLTGTIVPGSGYVNNTYVNVPLTGGTGTGAKATITVSGTAVTAVVVTTLGTGYSVADSLSASNANLGGSGSGFSIPVSTIGGWSTTTISGTYIAGGALVPSNLIHCCAFKQRMWYVENNSMNVWFTSISGYQGTLTQLPLGTLFRMGGTLMAMSNWTVDNVSGLNDFAAFITTEGEVAIYEGFDPTQAPQDWALVGIFRIGRPIGRRCFVKVGSDVYVITADGLTPLSKAMLTDRTQPGTQITYKIENAINTDVQTFSGNFGWQVILHPIGQKLIVNVPEGNGAAHQWVMNQVTNAWCRFRNWNATCFEVQGDTLYFGTTGGVFQADTGMSDAGKGISVDCKPAFSYFNAPGQIKLFQMARPIMQTSSAISPTVTLNVDFQDIANQKVKFSSGGVSLWNVSPWNTTPWSGTGTIFTTKSWQGLAGLGYVGSGRISMQIAGIACQWFSTDYMFSAGGPI